MSLGEAILLITSIVILNVISNLLIYYIVVKK